MSIDSYVAGVLHHVEGEVDTGFADPTSRYEACGFGSGWSVNAPALTSALDNPTDEPDVDRAIDKAAKLVSALGKAERALVYHVLHAEGERIVPGSFVEAYRRARAK